VNPGYLKRSVFRAPFETGISLLRMSSYNENDRGETIQKADALEF